MPVDFALHDFGVGILCHTVDRVIGLTAFQMTSLGVYMDVGSCSTSLLPVVVVSNRSH